MKYLLLCVLVCSFYSVFGQEENNSPTFSVHSNVDTSDSEINEIVQFYKTYFTAPSGGKKREILWDFKGQKISNLMNWKIHKFFKIKI